MAKIDFSMIDEFQGYSAEIEDSMQYMFESLNEKDRRHYAAIEAKKLGSGGVKYISKLFGISEKTIEAGLKEFEKKVFWSAEFANPALDVHVRKSKMINWGKPLTK